MTPWEQFVRSIDALELQNTFERIVYDAVAAERERCAKVAESFVPSGFRGGDGKMADAIGIARDDRARTIAAAIRASTSHHLA